MAINSQDAVVALLKAAAPLTIGTELAALLSGKLNGVNALAAAIGRLLCLGRNASPSVPVSSPLV